jgi:UDP-N-acetylenolpyruvoylglucosamine reductase
MKKIALLAIVIFMSNAKAKVSFRHYMATSKLNSEYQKLMTLESEGRLLCPGLKLVKSCGNLICEAEKKETKENCPSDCNPGKVHSYNHLTICRDIKTLYKPETSKEIKTALKVANSLNLRVKIVGARHSASDIMCTDGIMLDMSNYNKILGLEKFQGEMTVKVQGGVIISDLAEWLHKKGYSLGYTLMGFRGVTMAGAIGTGSHGSSPKHTAIISNIVRSVKVIDASGSEKVYSKKSSDQNMFKALKASLGLLGVITELRFKVIPQFNLDVKVTTHNDEELLRPNGILNVVKDCDYGQLNWFPGKKKFVKTCGHETTAPAEKGANNVLLDPKIAEGLVGTFKQVLQLGACYKGFSCLIESFRYSSFKNRPPFEKEVNGKLKRVGRVTGPSHRMISSNLTKHQHGFFQMDWEIAVPASRAHEAILKVNDHLKRNKICLPLVGVFVRYAPSEPETLIAHTTSANKFKSNEISVFIEIPTYLPVGFFGERYESYHRPYKEFARFLIEEFDGRPHWGKNREWTFLLNQQKASFGSNWKAFQEAVKKSDPNGIFSNKLSKSLDI